jgi:DNA-binding NarL/FixJ family response regulator
MSVEVQSGSGPAGIPVRILVAGSDLLAGALASALTAYGFSTKNVVPREPEIGRAIGWRPNLVLVDARSLDVTSGFALVRQLSRADLRFCVIDKADDGERENLWKVAGASALIDRSEPFDELFRTITRLLRTETTTDSAPRSPSMLALAHAEQPAEFRLQPFTVLTEREQIVLAELMEGHCAEEIANAAYVSISTIRSQIKAILQKLGVNSQLAAVAHARRAGWSLVSAPGYSPREAGPRRARVS